MNDATTLTAPLVTSSAPIPQFIRLPKPGTLCPWTGLSRSTMNALILPTLANKFHPPVASRVLRQRRGQLKGVRLVLFESLMDYLKNQTDDGATKPDEAIAAA